MSCRRVVPLMITHDVGVGVQVRPLRAEVSDVGVAPEGREAEARPGRHSITPRLDGRTPSHYQTQRVKTCRFRGPTLLVNPSAWSTRNSQAGWAPNP